MRFEEKLDSYRSSRFNEMESRMLKLHKSSPCTPQVNVCVRWIPGKPPGIKKIESTDRAIDRLVYELYGITEDEVKKVEGEITI